MTDLFNQDVDKGAAKYDAGKPRMDLLPFESLTAVASVFTFGAEKYDDWNWMKGEGLDPDRLLAAALRHIAAHQRDPKQVDRESMLPHYWHATTCMLMMTAIIMRREGMLAEDGHEIAARLRSKGLSHEP